MNKKQTLAWLRASLVLAVLAVGMLLGPGGLLSSSDRDARVLDSQMTGVWLVRAQTRPEVSRPRLDQRDRRYRQSSRLPDPVGPQPPPTEKRIKVEFKLDPRVTSSAYMGDRWVSPLTFTLVQQGAVATIDGRAFLLDPNGADTKAIPEWTSANLELVTVTPGEGNRVVLTVNLPGESSLQVSSQGTSKTLSLKATTDGTAIRVDITQD